MPTIRIDQVAHSFGERRVLEHVDLTITEPRVGIIGANGCGKSTLARMLNGLVQPTEGRVTVDGLDPAREGAAVRRRVGFTFPDPEAQIVMPTVREDVEFSLRRRRDLTAEGKRRLVDEVLARYALADHADHPAHQLSSGQKQLLALAAILVTRPDVLVCDEPTTLLDLRHAHQVSRLLDTLDQQVVLVTHHLWLLDGWERVVLIDGGRVAADGPADEVVPFYRRLMLEGG
ncbi:energy-coupling factor ABC transporter ATP-binding protein [Arsenicicoccus sp. oral taxon 190]|uniref:energy-coupling factor ABC transporter ATP-binding protein n=1 Tax=Arsenicicoccus sp. oral taxon 190 TaxID=1658671 RepID=UPI000679EDC3|nr:ABC transporter ATP-binding protein [Arsenicicoccus sp. oral taxon 190]AKT51252.1 cobalt ABC transporter ATP-binding protein [Arsenicicoccus sp. oral taxon 190]